MSYIEDPLLYIPIPSFSIVTRTSPQPCPKHLIKKGCPASAVCMTWTDNFVSQSLPCHLCRTRLGDLSLLSYHVDCVRCYEHSLLFFLFSFHYLGLFLSPCYFFLSSISFCLETSFTFFGRLFLPPGSLDTTRQSLTHSPIPLHR